MAQDLREIEKLENESIQPNNNKGVVRIENKTGRTDDTIVSVDGVRIENVVEITIQKLIPSDLIRAEIVVIGAKIDLSI